MKSHKSKEVEIRGKEHKRKETPKSEVDNIVVNIKSKKTKKNLEKFNDDGKNSNTNLVEHPEYCKKKETSVISDVNRKQHNKKKNKLSLLNKNMKRYDPEQLVQTASEDWEIKGNKLKFKRMYTDNACNADNIDEMEPPKKKKMLLNLTSEEYKPGMLSNILQTKKYGSLIVPWDPSFGLDPKYKSTLRKPEENGQKSKLKINPLFDLSKRSDGNVTSSNSIENSIFVGNLPKNIKVNKLKKIFKKCGFIVQVKIRCEESKNPLKFTAVKNNLVQDNKSANAVIKFQNLESCKKALKMNGKLYEGHHLRVTLAKDKVTFDPKKSVFVGNVAFKAQDDDLWKVFESCGGIESVRVVRDTQTGKGKGFGYINFQAAESVEKALLLDKTTLLERNIRVTRNQIDSKSLSNSITVKRKKRKKFIPGNVINGEYTKRKLQSTEIVSDDTTKLGNKKKKTKLKNIQSLETETSMPSKLKKKKKAKMLIKKAE